jgi:hypothetical protein
MARNLKFKIEGKSCQAAIVKFDRSKVYGFVEEIVTDRNGKVCSIGSLMDDGQTIILSGATALKTVDDSLNEVDKKTLKTVYMDGKDAVLVPSSYDSEIELTKCSLDDLFNLEVTTSYQLTWESDSEKSEMLNVLESESLYRFVFNYRADYEGSDAILLRNQDEVFILTGRYLEFDYLENKVIYQVEEIEENVEEEEDEIDFGMF